MKDLTQARTYLETEENDGVYLKQTNKKYMLVHFFAATLQLWHIGGIRLWQFES